MTDLARLEAVIETAWEARTDVSPRTGGDVLAKVLETDEGARRLGEVALVPASSAISA